ncbi:MAG: thiamine pyrophosphate-dependent dehydrogenase E1 component subunit alpha [Deltaproteobacteria bacterium]|nr:thiamine pyrophosphate-dependent dehydrogenase E1 component subunit alpha [Deltaproteobacteria bacterium]
MEKELNPGKRGDVELVADDLDEALLLEMFRKAYTIRRFEQRCVELYREGFIRGYFHPYLGEEGVAVGSIAAIGRDDYIVSTHRGHGHCICKGGDLKLMMAEIMGRETGYCNGRGGSMHIANLDDHNLGANGIVGGGIPIATGAALGIKIKKGGEVVLGFFSDGAANNGVFGESLNLAAIFDLPVVFVLENNHYAVSTPVEYSSRVTDLARRADGYGMPGVTVDGNDAVAVYLETKKAVSRARRGKGPTLIEAKTYRHGGHHVNDPGLYMDQAAMARWKSRDPVDLLRKRLNDDAKIREIEEEVESELAEAVEFAKKSPAPSVEEFLASIEDY